MGADVTVVEPPGGSPQRAYGPFLDDEAGTERSLWWWHYNTSKRGVVVDPATDRDALDRLIERADVLLVGEDTAGLDPAALTAADPRLIVVSITPFGIGSPAPASRSPTSRCSPRAGRRGAAATTTTRSRPCAVAATRASRPPATGR